MFISIDTYRILGWIQTILELAFTVTLIFIAVLVFYFRLPIQEAFIYLIPLFAVGYCRQIVVYHRDFHAYNSTLGLVLEYAFGEGADPDECLQKIIEWGEKEGLDIEIK